MVNPDFRILFCGMLKSPFILQDLELLQKYYHVKVINLNILQTGRFGFIMNIFPILAKVIINVHNIDVIYIWFADVHAFPLVVLSKLFRKKSVMTVGGWEVAKYPEINYGNQLNIFKGALTRWCLRNVNVVLVPSQAYKIVTKSIEPVSTVCVIPNAINKLLCEYPLPVKTNKIVTALCTLQCTSVLKGIPVFEAASKLVPYECIVYEALKHDKLMERLRWAKVYCQLSYTESFGVTNLEAMACGCVPIVTDRDALPEIIGDTGIVVPYGDVEATAKAMCKAMTMDGNAARERSKIFTREPRLEMLAMVLENKYVDTPLVTVVIPSYNAARWLPDTIGSIINQTYKNIEIIVVDDYSTDNTEELISKFPMVKYFKNSENMGECYSSWRGFKESAGYYVCRLSADDMYANPDKLMHQVACMERTGADWSYNNINCVGETLKTAKVFTYFWMILPTRYAHRILQVFDNYILTFPYFAYLRMFFGNPVNSSTFMFRKSSYMKSVGWLNTNIKTDCDGWLLYNLFLDRFKGIAIQELGAFYRIHPDQATNTSKRYLNDVRNNKLASIDKVLAGNYPIWLKCAVKLIRRWKL